ncbi:MAG: hypothetical protein NWE89_13880 [Candidatus Bathyarchaeota archaeon]|nr:hypothetical protein [Candidatus Bathyarchaeota archaeon]
MYGHFKSLVKRALTKETTTAAEGPRRVRIQEETPSDRFILIVALMIIFFAGLIFLEVIHMVWMGTWNDVIFNGIMLVVGTIVGAVWGKTAQ